MAGNAVENRGAGRQMDIEIQRFGDFACNGARHAIAVAGDHAHGDALSAVTYSGITSLGKSCTRAAAILLCAGRLSQSWKPSITPSFCSGISEWITPRPAVIHCTPPFSSKPFVPGAVAVAHATGEHVGHGLEAAMRMVWKAGDVVVRIVAAECVEHQEGVEPVLQLAGKYAGQLHAGAVRGGDALDEPVDSARLL